MLDFFFTYDSPGSEDDEVDDGKSQYVCVEWAIKLEQLDKCSKKLEELTIEKTKLDGYFETLKKKRGHGSSPPKWAPGKSHVSKVPRHHPVWN